MSTLLQYVDTAMVGHLGEKATAAVSTTTTVTWLVNSIPYGISIAILALTAKECGAGNREKTRLISGQACFLALITGTVMTFLCIILSPYIPAWMNAQKDVRKNASVYFFIISIPMIFRTADIIFGAAIRAVKNTKTPMLINLLANALNIVLNAIFIYGLKMGVMGAAIATAVSYTISGVLMTVFCHREEFLAWSREDLHTDSSVMKQCMKIAIPAMGNNVASCAGYVVFAGMVSGMGTVTFAAHSIAVTAETLFYIPGYGLRTAAASLIGNAIGEGDRQKTEVTERLTIFITIVMMIASGICLWFVAYPLMCLFTNSKEVARLGAEMLKLVAFTEPFFGIMIALEGIFYGMGRTKAVFIIETFSMWGIRILLTFLCTQIWRLDLRAVWYCMIADNICKAVLLVLVYRHVAIDTNHSSKNPFAAS